MEEGDIVNKATLGRGTKIFPSQLPFPIVHFQSPGRRVRFKQKAGDVHSFTVLVKVWSFPSSYNLSYTVVRAVGCLSENLEKASISCQVSLVMTSAILWCSLGPIK